MSRAITEDITTDIILKIIGHTDARGETEYDKESLENLDQLYDVMFALSMRLYENIVDNRNSNAFSRTQIYEKSKEILEEIINGRCKDVVREDKIVLTEQQLEDFLKYIKKKQDEEKSNTISKEDLLKFLVVYNF